MATHTFQDNLTIEQLNQMTPAEVQEYFDSLPAPGAGIDGFEVNNTDQGREIEAFGIKINDQDDIISVGLVLIIALVVYVFKSIIDEFFARRIERYKLRINK